LGGWKRESRWRYRSLERRRHWRVFVREGKFGHGRLKA